MRQRYMIVLACAMLAGCVNQQEMDELAEAKVAAELREAEALAVRAEAQAKLAEALAAGDTARAELEAAKAALATAEAEKATRAAEAADKAMDAGGGEAEVRTVGGIVAPFAGPYGPIIDGIVVGLLGGLLRARQQKMKALAIARAIQKAKNGGTAIDFANPTTKLALETMGPAAKKLVDEAQGGKATLPI